MDAEAQSGLCAVCKRGRDYHSGGVINATHDFVPMAEAQNREQGWTPRWHEGYIRPYRKETFGNHTTLVMATADDLNNAESALETAKTALRRIRDGDYDVPNGYWEAAGIVQRYECGCEVSLDGDSWCDLHGPQGTARAALDRLAQSSSEGDGDA